MAVDAIQCVNMDTNMFSKSYQVILSIKQGAQWSAKSATPPLKVTFMPEDTVCCFMLGSFSFKMLLRNPSTHLGYA